MDKRKLAEKRAKLPLYKNMGELDQVSAMQFLDQFPHTPSSIHNAVELRNYHNGAWGDELTGYDQYDIQYAQRYSQYDDPDYFFQEQDYVHAKPEFSEGISAIEKIIGGKCYRLRYSTLEPGAILDWHMDQPTLDRFICVLSGKQRFEIKQRKNVFNVTQEPLAIWFINASWEHRVINMNNDKRLALLGCFEYNK